jgi:hypothetical protein
MYLYKVLERQNLALKHLLDRAMMYTFSYDQTDFDEVKEEYMFLDCDAGKKMKFDSRRDYLFMLFMYFFELSRNTTTSFLE